MYRAFVSFALCHVLCYDKHVLQFLSAFSIHMSLFPTPDDKHLSVFMYYEFYIITLS